MTLVDRIKTLADQHSLNIKQLEMQLEFSNGTIRRWDSSSPSADKLYKLANFLNTSCEYLLTGEGKAPSSFISTEDMEWLELIHKLPKEVQLEYRGEIKGYLRCLNKADSNKELKQAK